MGAWPQPVSDEVVARQRRYQKNLGQTVADAYRAALTPATAVATRPAPQPAQPAKDTPARNKQANVVI